jgi:hypothetical protein
MVSLAQVAGLAAVVAVAALAVVVIAFKRASSAAARSGSWLPGIPAPPAHLPRSIVLGHLKHFATSVPQKHGFPDTLSGQREVFASAARTQADLRGHASAAAAAVAARAEGSAASPSQAEDSPYAGQLPSAGLTAFWFMREKAVAAVRGDHVRALLNASVERKKIPMRGHHVSRVLGDASLAMADDKELWQTHRKLVTRGFYAESLSKIVPAMDASILKLVHSLRRRYVCDRAFWSSAVLEYSSCMLPAVAFRLRARQSECMARRASSVVRAASISSAVCCLAQMQAAGCFLLPSCRCRASVVVPCQVVTDGVFLPSLSSRGPSRRCRHCPRRPPFSSSSSATRPQMRASP